MDGRRRALIVASGEYDHDGLARLASPAADAVELAKVLVNKQISDFEVDVVRDEVSHEIQARIEDLFLESRPDDVLLLHISCHGIKGESGMLYFAARNTRPTRLGSSAISAAFVQQCMQQARARNIVVLLDCCYGGAFSEGVAVRAAGDVNVHDNFPTGRLGGGRGRAVITASNSVEYAFEGEVLSDERAVQPSVFTSALVEGLATGAADRDEDGLISLNELYDYVFDRVRERNPNQTPSRDIEMQGELYLARSQRRRISALPIPADLQAAISDPNMFTRLGALSELTVRLHGSNLAVAAGALEALRAMAEHDIQNVAERARSILLDAAPRGVAASLDVGRVAVGVGTHRQVSVLGPPLARAGTVSVSASWLSATLTDAGLDIGVTASAVGSLHGTVTFTSQTGTVEIAVAAEGVSQRAAKATPIPDQQEKKESLAAEEKPFNLLRLSAPVAIVAAMAIIVGALYDFNHAFGSMFERWESLGLPWLAVAVVAVVAGIGVGRARSQVSCAGLLFGIVIAAVASTYALVVSGIRAITTSHGFWVLLAGHILLIVAGIIAFWGLVRQPDVRLRGRWLDSRSQWTATVIGLVGAVVYCLLRIDVVSLPLLLLIAAELFLLPLWATGIHPRALGSAVLLGWALVGETASLASVVRELRIGSIEGPQVGLLVLSAAYLALAVVALVGLTAARRAAVESQDAR